jgi:hypothetical protein
LVEHDLAKVGVAGSSPVFRSAIHQLSLVDFFSIFHKVLFSPGGGTGRHAGLKILWAAMPVRVQLPSGAHHYFLYFLLQRHCPGGEIGRRTTLRWWRPKGCAGSNPVSGTEIKM